MKIIHTSKWVQLGRILRITLGVIQRVFPSFMHVAILLMGTHLPPFVGYFPIFPIHDPASIYTLNASYLPPTRAINNMASPFFTPKHFDEVRRSLITTTQWDEQVNVMNVGWLYIRRNDVGKLARQKREPFRNGTSSPGTRRLENCWRSSIVFLIDTLLITFPTMKWGFFKYLEAASRKAYEWFGSNHERVPKKQKPKKLVWVIGSIILQISNRPSQSRMPILHPKSCRESA